MSGAPRAGGGLAGRGEATASGAAAPTVTAGWCSPEVEAELPGLRVHVAEVLVVRRDPLTGDSPGDIQSRLRALSSRFRGGRAVSLRGEPVPAAYRAFFRQIGMDPDSDRTPIEAAVLERMVRGGFPTGGLIEDVLMIALLDTSVPVWGLDSDTLDGPLGIRASLEAEPLGRSEDAPLLPAGRLVVADSSVALAVLFGDLAPAHSPRRATRRLHLFSIQVPGVPALYVEEALWCAASALLVP